MSSNTTADDRTLSSIAYHYLDTLPREIALQIKPSNLRGIPEFANADRRLLSSYLSRWKRKKLAMQTLALTPAAPASTPRKKTTRRRTAPRRQNEENSTDIDEQFVEAMLIQCAQDNPTDPRVANLLIQWLDKKKAIAPKKEIGEHNEFATEFEKIQREVFEYDTQASNDNTALDLFEDDEEPDEL